uniref:Small integral membrane protein 19 n=1 Tax=Salmo trutta TaxID=8032 RepID=A0A674BXK7_SALTR
MLFLDTFIQIETYLTICLIAMGGHGVMANEESLDYSVHEAWNEATNVYLLVILVSFGLLMYARKNKRKIMRIFALPPTAGATTEPNFYDSLQKVRLRQQLEMYSLGEFVSHSECRF